MEKLYKIVKLLAVACVIPITVFLCLFLHALQQTTEQTGKIVAALPGQVDARVDKLQTQMLSKLDTVQDKLSSDLRFVASTADKRLSSLTTVADNRLAAIQTDTLDQVKGLRSDINQQLTTTNASVNTLTTAYAGIPTVLGDRYERDFSKYFSCATNELCLQGQASDTMFAIRTTSREVSKTMQSVNNTLPQIEGDVKIVSDTFAVEIPKITANVEDVATNINRLTSPHWYDKILGYLSVGIGIYRNLNPVTNLTISGAQFVATRP